MMSKLSTGQRQVQAASRIADAQGILAAEVAKLTTGEDWRRFLAFQAKVARLQSEQRDACRRPARSSLR